MSNKYSVVIEDDVNEFCTPTPSCTCGEEAAQSKQLSEKASAEVEALKGSWATFSNAWMQFKTDQTSFRSNFAFLKLRQSCRKGKVTNIKINNPFPGKQVHVSVQTSGSRCWGLECVLWDVASDNITLRARNRDTECTFTVHLIVTGEFSDCVSLC